MGTHARGSIAGPLVPRKEVFICWRCFGGDGVCTHVLSFSCWFGYILCSMEFYASVGEM